MITTIFILENEKHRLDVTVLSTGNSDNHGHWNATRNKIGVLHGLLSIHAKRSASFKIENNMHFICSFNKLYNL